MFEPKFVHGCETPRCSPGTARVSDLEACISDDESLFSSSYESEFLRRLSLAVANIEKHIRRNRELGQRAAIRSWPGEQDWYALRRPWMESDNITCAQSTATRQSIAETCWYSSEEESTSVDESPERSTSRPSEQQSPSRGRTRTRDRPRRSSSADCALPPMRLKKSATVEEDPASSNEKLRAADHAKLDAGAVPSFRARLTSRMRADRSQDDVRRVSRQLDSNKASDQRASSIKVDVVSPALAKRLGVPVSSQVDMWM